YLRDMNWLGDRSLEAIPADGIDLYAKVRSTRPPTPARLFAADGAIAIELAQGESGVARGQACALYSDDSNDARVLGGGFIERAERHAEAEAMLGRLADQPAA